MYQKITRTKTAINRSSAMETETISKNGASLKSHTSRGNNLISKK